MKDTDNDQGPKDHQSQDWFARIAKQLGNVSQACKMLGYCRDSFYRFKELYDKGGDLAIAKGSACAVAGTAVIYFTFMRLEVIPRSTPVVHFLVLVTALIVGCLVRRIMIQRREIGLVFDIRHDDERNVIIVGARHFAWFYIRLLDAFATDNRRVVAILDEMSRCVGVRCSGMSSSVGRQRPQRSWTISRSMGFRHLRATRNARSNYPTVSNHYA